MHRFARTIGWFFAGVAIGQAEEPVVSSIVIHGNGRTDEAVIRRILDIEPGDALVPGTGDRQWRRLMETGFFRDVHIRVMPGTEKGRPVFDVTVLEKNEVWEQAQEYGYRLPYGAYARVSGALLNPMGQGRTYGADLELESRRWQINAEAVEPWFRGSEWDGGLGMVGEFFGDQRLFPFLNSDPTVTDGEGSHRFTRTGGELFGRRRLDDFHDIRLAYHIDRVDVGPLEEVGDTSMAPGVFEAGVSRVAYLAVDLTRDSRSRSDRGLVLRAHARAAMRWLGSTEEHGRFGVDGDFFFPGLREGHDVRLGSGFLVTTREAPYSERLRLGTDVDLVGFRSQEVGSQGVERLDYADAGYGMKIGSMFALNGFVATTRASTGSLGGEWESVAGAGVAFKVEDWVEVAVRQITGLGSGGQSRDRLECSVRLIALDDLTFGADLSL